MRPFLLCFAHFYVCGRYGRSQSILGNLGNTFRSSFTKVRSFVPASACGLLRCLCKCLHSANIAHYNVHCIKQ